MHFKKWQYWLRIGLGGTWSRTEIKISKQIRFKQLDSGHGFCRV